MKTLETQRLILRDWKEADLDDMYEYACVDGVGEMAGWPHHENKEVSKKILESFINKGDVYAIVLKEENKVIGSLGVHNKKIDSNYIAVNQRSLGYVLSKAYWGRGLMPEAVYDVINYAFEELNVDVLWCGHFVSNLQSKNVIEKSGFKFYCNGIYEASLLNKSYDEKKYIMTKNDYKALRSK
jgi:ribosomal-protein-alanine N-acetyltransferase